MSISLKSNKKVALVVAFFVLVALATFFITQSVKTSNPAVSFAWNDSSRNLTTFGINSAPLRTIYQYELDPNSYYPLYSNAVAGCEILGKYDTSKLSGNEEKATTSLVAAYASQGVSDVQENNMIFRGDNVVPVKTVSYEQEGKFYGVFGRWFTEEKVQLVVSVTCETTNARDVALIQALRSFSVVEKASSY
jgi:hypothetical protein